jgi:hypothetical protein
VRIKMKNYILVCLLFPLLLQAQLGNRYFWTDTLTVSGTSRDTTFAVEWEEVCIYADTVDLLIRIGAPDVGSWNSRLWFKLLSGHSLAVGPVPKVKRIEVKTVTGTGTCYLLGYKKSRQY